MFIAKKAHPCMILRLLSHRASKFVRDLLTAHVQRRNEKEKVTKRYILPICSEIPLNGLSPNLSRVVFHEANQPCEIFVTQFKGFVLYGVKLRPFAFTNVLMCRS